MSLLSKAQLRVQRLIVRPIVRGDYPRLVHRKAQLFFVGERLACPSDLVDRDSVDTALAQPFRHAIADVLVEQEGETHEPWLSVMRASISAG
jgi:hypothetical protein